MNKFYISPKRCPIFDWVRFRAGSDLEMGLLFGGVSIRGETDAINVLISQVNIHDEMFFLVGVIVILTF